MHHLKPPNESIKLDVTRSVMKAFCTLTVKTLLKLPVRSRQMMFNMPKAKFSWCFYKRTSFRTVSDTVCAHPRFSLERCEVCIRLIPTISPTILSICVRTLLRTIECHLSDMWHVIRAILGWFASPLARESLITHTLSFTLVYFLNVFRVHQWRWICGLLTSTD